MDLSKFILNPLLESEDFYRKAECYYEGDVEEIWSSNRLRKLMRMRARRKAPTINFLRPVVDNVNNRLKINNVVADTARASKLIDRVRKANNMHLEEQEIHRRALVYGEAYAVVWPDDNGEWLISYHTPKDTVVVYDPENPRKKLFGARVWYDIMNEGHRLDVYFADRVEKYFSKTEELTMGMNWTHIETIENPFDEVPMFHFRTRNPHGRPEHVDGYHIQDAINKLCITHLVTVDYQGAPQRWALEESGEGSELMDFEEGETEREQQNALQSHPGELWLLKNTKMVGEFKPANPEVFWAPIKDNILSLASLTNTPLHYFQSTGNVPSGNALRAAEAPLLKKVAERQESFGATWRDLYSFIIRVEFGKEEEVKVLWESVESIDILEQWDVIAKKANSGVPFRQRMIEAGYDELTIDRMIEWKQKEKEELGNLYERESKATNTSPDVRVNLSKDETKIDTEDEK